jgi:uncharacterized membrane protein YfcA
LGEGFGKKDFFYLILLFLLLFYFFVTGPGLRYYHKQIPTSRTYPPRGPLAHPVHTGALVGAGVGGLGVGEVRVCVHTQRDTR